LGGGVLRGGEEGRRAGGLIKERRVQSQHGNVNLRVEIGWTFCKRERERERACKKSLERKWWDLDV